MTSITLMDLKDCDTCRAISKLAVRYRRYVSIHLARLTKLSEEAGLEAFIAIKLNKTPTSQYVCQIVQISLHFRQTECVSIVSISPYQDPDDRQLVLEATTHLNNSNKLSAQEDCIKS